MRYRHAHKSCCISYTELIHHVMSMGFDCANGDEKFFCDFACCRFVQDVAKDFLLSPGQGRKVLPILLYCFSLHPGKECIGEIVTEKRTATMHFTDTLLQFLLPTIFQKITLGSCLDHRLHMRIISVDADGDYFDFRITLLLSLIHI